MGTVLRNFLGICGGKWSPIRGRGFLIILGVIDLDQVGLVMEIL